MNTIINLVVTVLAFCLITVLSVLVVIIFAHLASTKPARWADYYQGNQKKILKAPGDWRGTPLDSKGRFLNDLYPFYQNYVAILIWLPGHVRNLISQMKLTFPVRHMAVAELNDKDETITWLGHASFFFKNKQRQYPH